MGVFFSAAVITHLQTFGLRLLYGKSGRDENLDGDGAEKRVGREREGREHLLLFALDYKMSSRQQRKSFKSLNEFNIYKV